MSWPVRSRVEYSGTDPRGFGSHSEWLIRERRVTGDNVRIPSGTQGTVIAKHGHSGSIVRWDHDPRPTCVNEHYMRLVGDLPSGLEPEEVEKWLRA